MIPNETIDQILDKIDIVEIISARVSIRKAGQSFKGLCPFHEEKTPSFMVNPSRQIFHCFGCGAGGNAIGFLMKYEKMDFIEALKTLADKANIALPYSQSADKTKSSPLDVLYDVNNAACNFYQDNLTKDTGKEARGYFSERGIDEKTIKLFRLGFAQDSWQGLMNHAVAQKIRTDILEKAGLILQNADTKNWYDRFRNRVIFPIFDPRNKVLGFGARALDNSLPKYINSPETPIYRKGKHLYGLNFSKDYIRRQNYVIIVEGYFDLIIPFQNGIRNIVATLGTALTTEQTAALKRFTNNVIMIYDADKAGEEAMLRGLDILIGEDMNVRIAVLPKGDDPDSFVRREGSAGFAKILKESRDIFDYKLGILTARFRKSEPRGKARIVEEMLPTLAIIKNAVLKSAYLKKISQELSVDEEAVRAELKNVKPNYTRDYSRGSLAPEKKGGPGPNLAEITLLAIILDDASYIEKIESETGLAIFRESPVNDIFKKISELHKSGKKITVSHLLGYFTTDDAEKAISEAANLAETIKDKERVMRDCVRHLRKDSLKEMLKGINFKIKEAEKADDTEEVKRLVAEYNTLVKGRAL